ncbi:signal transduction histidine kinase [Spinactinospora alkalitolerans]|uniref:histidine kinase n=1 Tax=Spinactinospora alkalitolerans TaxID=687207 RepID=A0A852TY19_9ACTN|nr:sensor histidine kinase [Spinactinospora alkalitolerans]NYE46914.1 signal transduction histidine kinase [Spinactinospora alkalitolerans]
MTEPKRRIGAAARARKILLSGAVLTDAFIVALLAVGNAATVALLAGESGGWVPYEPGRPASEIVGAVLLLALFARRSLPFTVLAVLALGGLGADLAGLFTWGGVGPAIAIAAYSIGRHHALVRSLIGLLAGLVVDLASTALSPATGSVWPDYAFYVGWLIGAWWIGRLVRMRAFHVAELRARAERLERARDAHARAVLAEERSRIARELHDVVAHHVSVMTVQATAGSRVIGRDPERARQALTDIEATGRQALSEMRRIVGVLRTSGTEDAQRGPQPGLGDLTELVGQVRETGVAVTLRSEGCRVPLPPGLDLTLYRVVQESLTNVLKHAGERTRTEVRVCFEHRAVRVEVEDDGAGPFADARGGDEPGHGLLGMRERIALFGGELEAGPRPAGGFSVRARVPLESGGPAGS